MAPCPQATRKSGHLCTKFTIGQNCTLVHEGDSGVRSLREDGFCDVHAKDIRQLKAES
jgi:hypothetical protein